MDEVKGYVNAQTMLEMLEQYQGCYFPHSAAVYIVNKLTQTDVVEVVHGRWIICSDGYYPYCSECKEEPKHGEMTNYCPNCGAKMDLE